MKKEAIDELCVEHPELGGIVPLIRENSAALLEQLA
jgi:hypothetical protein